MAVKRSVKSMFMVCGGKQRQGKLKLGLAHENENPTLVYEVRPPALTSLLSCTLTCCIRLHPLTFCSALPTDRIAYPNPPTYEPNHYFAHPTPSLLERLAFPHPPTTLHRV